MHQTAFPTSLSDSDLVVHVKQLAQRERQAIADLVAALAEFDERRLYLGAGCSSLFTYCTQVLHLSEHAAYRRIEAARAARQFPVILDRIASGDINLTVVGLLKPHLTAENHRQLLDAAQHQSKRVVEEIVARIQPRPDVPSSIRRLPGTKPVAALTGGVPQKVAIEDDGGVARTQASIRSLLETGVPPVPGPALAEAVNTAEPETLSELASTRLARQIGSERIPVASAQGLHPPTDGTGSGRAVIAPLAVDRYKVQMTVSAETHAKLRRAQELLRHSIPNGDPALVFDRALTVLIERLEKTRFAAKSPRTGTRSPARAKKGGRLAPTTEGPDAPRVSEIVQTGSSDQDLNADRSSPKLVPERVDHSTDNGRTSGSRHIPAAVKREVWARDGGRCTFAGAAGRCRERSFLEFHHVIPHATGGRATVDNLVLACRQHNGFEADRFFGWRRVTQGDDGS